MPILTIIFTLVIVGLMLWVVETYVPMSPPIKTVLRVVVLLFVLLWLLQVIGLLGPVVRVR